VTTLLSISRSAFRYEFTGLVLALATAERKLSAAFCQAQVRASWQLQCPGRQKSGPGHFDRRVFWRGGPAVCAAPAGSRSDKKPRHVRSQNLSGRPRGPARFERPGDLRARLHATRQCAFLPSFHRGTIVYARFEFGCNRFIDSRICQLNSDMADDERADDDLPYFEFH
jgi:hypothetical protein